MNRPPLKPPQFSLTTILLVMTLVAICLALLRYAPCLGVAGLLLGPPALLRAAIVGYQRRWSGELLTLEQKIELVVMSFYAVLISLLAAIGAAMAAWIVVMFAFVVISGGMGPGVLEAIVAGTLQLVIGAATFVYILWCLSYPL